MARGVCVIGAGLAGVAAAVFAKKNGLDPVIISKGPAATAFSSGALDICGDPCAPHAHPESACADVIKNLSALILQNPRHPYAVLARESDGGGEEVLALVKSALDELFAEGGLFELSGCHCQNQACFTSLGTIKPAAMYPANTAMPGAPGMERPAVLGIMGLDFEPAMWAKIARENAARLGIEIEPQTGWVGFQGGHDRDAPALANEISQNPVGFIAAVIEAAEKIKGAAALVLPPVLPGPGRADLCRRIGEAGSMPVYETLSLPPSVPGLRLHDHLQETAKKAGIEIITGKAIGYHADAGVIKSLRLDERGRESVVEADAFVLAAGKFLAGGITKGRTFGESIFGLPVFVEDTCPGEIFIGKVLGLHVTERHALFEAGIKVDGLLRPLTVDSTPRFTNLFAAGAILAGHNYMSDATGAGVALATGARAGINAAVTFSRAV